MSSQFLVQYRRHLWWHSLSRNIFEWVPYCPFLVFDLLPVCSLQSRFSRTSVRSTAGSRGGGSWKGPSTRARPAAPVTPPAPVHPSTLPAPHQVGELHLDCTQIHPTDRNSAMTNWSLKRQFTRETCWCISVYFTHSPFGIVCIPAPHCLRLVCPSFQANLYSSNSGAVWCVEHSVVGELWHEIQLPGLRIPVPLSFFLALAQCHTSHWLDCC